MTEPEKYPSPNFSWSAQEPVLRPPVFQRTPEQGADTFQASRDWSWFQHQSTAHFSLYPSSGFSRYGAPRGPQPRYPGPYDYQPWRYDHGQNQWTKKTKQKEPEFSHFCDTCDRGFKVQAKYDEHIVQHVKCSVDDCKYTACEKLVKIHWKNTHAPGTKQIKLNTAEEIAKWREERRRNYPTLNNVQKKMKMAEIKEKRGDVLETARFGRFKTRRYKRGFKNHRGGAFIGHQALHPKSEVKQPPPHTSTFQDGDPLGALAPSDPDSEKEESAKELKMVVSVAPKKMTSALGSLISSYGDMTESESEKDSDNPIIKTALALEENKTMFAAHADPAQNKTQKFKERPITEESKMSNKVHNSPFIQSNHRGCGGQSKRWGRRGHEHKSESQKRVPTLLEMLLAPDIRHERNVVLQCVRYIIHNGFFGLACKDSNLVLSGAALLPDNHLVANNVIRSNQTKECDAGKGRIVEARASLVSQSKKENKSFLSQDPLCNKTHNTENAECYLQHGVVLNSSSLDQGTVNNQAELNNVGVNPATLLPLSQCAVHTDQLRVIPQIHPQSLVASDCPATGSVDPNEHSQSEPQLPSTSSNHASFEIPQDNSCKSLANKDQVSSLEYHENIQEVRSHQELMDNDVSTEERKPKLHNCMTMFDDDIWENSAASSETL